MKVKKYSQFFAWKHLIKNHHDVTIVHSAEGNCTENQQLALYIVGQGCPNFCDGGQIFYCKSGGGQPFLHIATII